MKQPHVYNANPTLIPWECSSDELFSFNPLPPTSLTHQSHTANVSILLIFLHLSWGNNSKFSNPELFELCRFSIPPISFFSLPHILPSSLFSPPYFLTQSLRIASNPLVRYLFKFFDYHFMLDEHLCISKFESFQ